MSINNISIQVSTSSKSLVFVDSAVTDYQSLIAGTIPSIEAVVLSPSRDGIEQITNVLQQHQDITAIHIVSHGSPGCLYLGNSQLNLENINLYTPQLQTWKLAASEGEPGRIYIYGCNVAAGDAGEEFIAKLHQITKARIAASAKRVGNVGLGGSWQLEKTTGEIVVDLAFKSEVIDSYSGVFAAGDLDLTFGGGDGIATTPIGTSSDLGYSLVIQPDGKIILVGKSIIGGMYYDFSVVRFNSNGTLDTSFGGGTGIVTTSIGSRDDIAYSVALQTDGKIVVGGVTYNPSSNSYNFVVTRYNNSGSLDNTFGSGGIVVTTAVTSMFNEGENQLILQPDGKIIMAGHTSNGTSSSNDFVLVRYNSNGTIDSSFGTGGIAKYDLGSNYEFGKTLTLQPDGKILVAGTKFVGSYDIALVRYNSNGLLDNTFGSGGIVTTDLGAAEFAKAIAILPSGKIIVAAYQEGNDPVIVLLQYNSNGTLDNSFGVGGVVTTNLSSNADVPYSLSVQADGKIVVVGQTYNAATLTDIAVLRYNSNGTLDSSFGGGDGIVTTALSSSHDYAQSIALQSDGAIVVGGSGNYDFAVARYLGTSSTNGNIPTEGDDFIVYTGNTNQNIFALGGNDTINAGQGFDTVEGGTGNDLLVVDYSSATISPNPSGISYNINVNTNIGPDGLVYGSVNTNNPNSQQNDSVNFANIERFQVTGSQGNDSINGSKADEILNGLGGNDTINGGGGNDTINAGSGNNNVDGGMGSDLLIVDYSAFNYSGTMPPPSGIYSNINSPNSDGSFGGTYSVYNPNTSEGMGVIFNNIERLQVTGTNLADTINGGSGDDVLNGGSGSDSINGGSGNDTINAGLGNYDVVDGSAGNDVLIIDYSAYNSGNYPPSAQGISSSVYSNSINSPGSVSGYYQFSNPNTNQIDKVDFINIERLQVTGTNLADSINGGSGDDLLNGGGGSDSIFGGDGNDTINAGTGSNDSVVGGLGSDRLVVDYSTANISTSVAGISYEINVNTNTNPGGFVSGNVNTYNPNTLQTDNLSFAEIELIEIIGSQGNDKINGSNADEIISGLGGNDSINGGGGNDTINAGAGNNSVDGGGGNDLLIIDYSALNYSGTTPPPNGIYSNINTNPDGNFTGNYSVGNPSTSEGTSVGFNNIERLQVTGTNLADNINGGSGDDILNGGGGSDTINGAAGNDTINAGLGNNNSVDGGAGNDLLIIDYSANNSGSYTATGQGISSTVYSNPTTPGSVSGSYQLSNPNTAQIDKVEFINIERLQVTGTNFADSINGSSGDDLLNGAGGSDSIFGGDGNDTINAGTGSNDTVNGGLGSDRLVVDYSTANINTSSPGSSYQIDITTNTSPDGILYGTVNKLDSNTLQTNTVNFANIEQIEVIGSQGHDSINGSNASEIINGGGGNDTIKGGGGNDTINAGAGNNNVDGGMSNDLLIVDYSAFNYSGTTPPPSGIYSNINSTNPDGSFGGTYSVYNPSTSEGTSVSFNNIERLQVTGTNLADTINGGSGDDVLNGAGGSDSIFGGSGNDTINAGLGYNDFVDGSAGNDVLIIDYSVSNASYSSTSGQGISSSVYGNSSPNPGSVSGYYQVGNPNTSQIDKVDFINIERLQVTGTNLADTINGGGGDDVLNGGAGSDSIFGGDGNDTINAGTGSNNSVIGGLGTDRLVVDYSTASVNTSSPSISYQINVNTNTNPDGIVSGIVNISNSNTQQTDSVSFGEIEQIEIIGSQGHDSIFGSNASEIINGAGGNDNINAGGGNDTINAGAGNNSVDGGGGNDLLIIDYSGFNYSGTTTSPNGIYSNITNNPDGSFSGDYSFGSVTTPEGTSVGFSNIERLQVTGTNLADSINGGSGDDVLNGGGGTDTINGAAGNDTINAGLGNNNSVDGGAGNDVLIIDYSTINFGNSPTSGQGISSSVYNNPTTPGSVSGYYQVTNSNTAQIDKVDFINIERLQVTGTNFADSINGGSGDDVLNGAGGSDSIFGGDGNDTINAGTGSNDTVNGGLGTDRLVVDYSTANASINSPISYEINVNTNVGPDGFVYGSVNTNNLNSQQTDSLSFTEIEQIEIVGSQGNDNINGSNTAEIINGAGGGDNINAGGGNDTINAGSGNNNVDGGIGNDLLIVDYSAFNYSGTTPPPSGIYSSINSSNPDGSFSGTYSVYNPSTSEGTSVSFTNIERLQVTGTNLADTINAGSGDDILNGLAGSDSINGGSGNDTINAGLGNYDFVDGSAGNDVLIIDYSAHNPGNSPTSGQGISSTVYGSPGSTSGYYQVSNPNTGQIDKVDFINIERLQVTGTNLADTINGGGGDDVLNGGAGSDSIFGGDGNDIINAGTGSNDSVIAGLGTDRLVVDYSTASVNTSSPNISYQFNVNTNTNPNGTVSGIVNTYNFNTQQTDSVSFAEIEQIEIIGSQGHDNINGSNAAEIINGAGGNDNINGGGGNDTIDAGAGNNSVDGAVGNDLLIIDYSTFNYSGTTPPPSGIYSYINSTNPDGSFSGNYSVYNFNTSQGTSVNFSNIERLQVTGTNLADTINGGSGDDILNGGGSSDSINGGSGNDTINAGLGANDSVDGGAGNDLLIIDYSAHNSGNSPTSGQGISSSVYTNPSTPGSVSGYYQVTNPNTAQIDKVNFINVERLQVTGTNFADSINGGSGDDVLNGAGGSDSIFGGDGNDTINAGTGGNDTVEGGLGTDRLVVDYSTANISTSLPSSSYQINVNTNIGPGGIVYGSVHTYNSNTPNTVNFANIEQIEVIGSQGNDSIFGSNASEIINGSGGNDSINGGGGNDTINAGLGSYDSVDGELGNDLLIVDYSSNTYKGGVYAPGISSYIVSDGLGGYSGHFRAYKDDLGNYDQVNFKNIENFQIFNPTGTTNYHNNAPVLTVLAAQTATEDTNLTLAGINIFDPDAGSNPVQVSLSAANGKLTFGSTTGLTFIGGSNGTNSMSIVGSLADINNALDNLVYLGNSNFNGSDSINLTVSDQGNTGTGGALIDSKTITVTVNPVNDAPIVANAIADKSVIQGNPFNFTLPANTFSDSDNGTLTYNASLADNNPLPSWLNFNSTTGTFSGTPSNGNVGTLSIKVTASDGSLSASDIFDLAILPTVSINDISFSEGNSGTTNAQFTVTLSAASDRNISLIYNTTNSTAVASENDYTASTGILTILAGQTTGTITIPVIGDTLYEPNETFKVTLSQPVNAGISKAIGTATILNDDNPSTTLSITGVSQNEGNSGTTNFNFIVQLSAPTAQDVTVNYFTGNGTAMAGSDYATTTGSLTILAGQTAGTIIIPVMADTTTEVDETFTVTLSNPVNALLTNQSQATGTIRNDDTNAAMNTTGSGLIQGGSGSDTLTGSSGNDTLVGVDSSSSIPGYKEIDVLTGGAGADTFVLGDASKIYYDDQLKSIAGKTDYALITDFTMEDTLKVKAGLTYFLQNSPSGVPSGTAIYINSNGFNGFQSTDEPIAVLQGVILGTTLTSAQILSRFVEV